MEGLPGDAESRDSFREAYAASVEYAEASDGWLVPVGSDRYWQDSPGGGHREQVHRER